MALKWQLEQMVIKYRSLKTIVLPLQTKVAQGTRSPKDVYSSILGLVGGERMKLVKAYILAQVKPS